MINLYHYSNNDFKGYIDPIFFGNSCYSKNSSRISGVKRSYFYLDKNKSEYFFYSAKFCYIAEIDEKKLYNLTADNLGIVKHLKNSQDIHKEVKKRGFKGLIGSNGFPCVVLFNKIKIKQKEGL